MSTRAACSAGRTRSRPWRWAMTCPGGLPSSAGCSRRWARPRRSTGTSLRPPRRTASGQPAAGQDAAEEAAAMAALEQAGLAGPEGDDDEIFDAEGIEKLARDADRAAAPF